MEWWTTLTIVQKVFACIAIPSTLLLIIQTLILLFGLGHSDADADAGDGHGFGYDSDTGDGDADVDTAGDGAEESPLALSSGLRLFTVRGFVTFFTVAGWSGLALLAANTGTVLTCIIAIAAGALAMYLTAIALKGMMKLQSDGTLDIRNALGVSGSVYITIPPARQGKGKVNITLQSQYSEFDAVTDEETPLKFGTEITVVGLSGANTLVVKKK